MYTFNYCFTPVFMQWLALKLSCSHQRDLLYYVPRYNQFYSNYISIGLIKINKHVLWCKNFFNGYVSINSDSKSKYGK